MTEDQRLLHEYVAQASRPALDELIRRHLGLVYSSALRQVHDPHLAEDVTQAVFLVLTQKAGTIRNGVAVGGWLLTVTRRAAVNAMRKQAIRHRHEHAAARPESAPVAQEQWTLIATLLDQELHRLPARDRDAVVLRFFQGATYAQVGAEAGLSEDAARKRVERAVQRLRGLLAQRGAAVEEGALGAAIMTHSAVAVPAHVLAAVMAAGGGGASAACVSIAHGVTRMMMWAQAKLIGAVAAAVVLGGAGAVIVTSDLKSHPVADDAVVIAEPPAPAAQAPAKQTPATAPALVGVKMNVLVGANSGAGMMVLAPGQPLRGGVANFAQTLAPISNQDQQAIARQLASPDANTRLAAVQRLVDMSQNDPRSLGIGMARWAVPLLNTKQYDDTVQLASEAVVVRALDPTVVEVSQRVRVLALIGLNEYDLALPEAKSYYNAAALAATPEAVTLLAQCLTKTSDAATAARFLATQAMTADGVAPAKQPDSPLNTISVDSSKYDGPIQVEERSVGPNGASYSNLMTRGDLLLLDDRPEEAKKCFQDACRGAGAKAKQVRDALEGVARSMRAIDQNVSAANVLIMSIRRDPKSAADLFGDPAPTSADLGVAASTIKLVDVAAMDRAVKTAP